MFQIRLLSPFRQEYQTGQYLFSRDIPSDVADALLCEWAPHDELLTFRGPKAWYNSEAVSRKLFDQPRWQQIKSSLEGRSLIYHAHPDVSCRVPMICFVNPLLKLDDNERIPRAIAVISNCGNSWPQAFEMIRLRNEFATHPLVDLYGKEENWRLYMQNRQSLHSLPENYRGEIKGTWNSQLKYDTMARYNVAICLENTTEPYYFTEKFHAAAQSGCIPIYHAHTTLREGLLCGAMWVDPADFNFDVEATLSFALAQDRKRYARNNFRWLETSQARATGLEQVFSRLGAILIKDLQ